MAPLFSSGKVDLWFPTKTDTNSRQGETAGELLSVDVDVWPEQVQ